MIIQNSQSRNELSNEEAFKLRKLLETFDLSQGKQDDFNKRHNHNNENSQKIKFFDLLFGKIKIATYFEELADDGTIDLPDATSGIGMVSAQGEEACVFTWTTAGVVSLVANTTNAVNTNTDAKLCVFDNGTYATIRNRLGAVKTIKYLIIY